MLHDRKRTLAVELAAVAIMTVLLSPTAWSGGSGRCVSASLPEAMILPDGTLRKPGLLRICLDREFSPVAGLHRVYVDGQAAGRFLSRSGQSEAAVDEQEPFIVLRRTPDGVLALEGYADPDGGRLNTYVLPSTARADYDVVSHWRTARQRDPGMILLAAARH